MANDGEEDFPKVFTLPAYVKGVDPNEEGLVEITWKDKTWERYFDAESLRAVNAFYPGGTASIQITFYSKEEYELKLVEKKKDAPQITEYDDDEFPLLLKHPDDKT